MRHVLVHSDEKKTALALAPARFRSSVCADERSIDQIAALVAGEGEVWFY